MQKFKTILLGLVFYYVHLNVIAQEAKPILVNETFSDVSLVHVLKTLRKHYDIKFAYDHKLIAPFKITGVVEDMPLESALDIILENTPFDYKVQESSVLILPPKASINDVNIQVSQRRFKQNFTVRGVIKDLQSGETLPFANISVKDQKIGTITNVDGFFSLLGLPNHPVTIEVSYLGYFTKSINVYPDESPEILTLYLSSKTEVLEELVIEDKESETIHSGDNISQLSINPSRLLSLPSLGEMDVFRTLQFLPGISGTDETSAGLIIRGSTPDQNLILFDGFSIYHIDHFFGVFSAFNSNAIKNIQIYKGAFESKYGGRASSVVDITGKSGNTNQPSYGIGLNLISANGVLELPIGKKMSLFMAARRSHTDILQTGLYREIFDKVIIDNREIINNLKDRDFEDIEPEFNFYDMNAKLTYRPNNKNVVALSYYSGRDNLKINANQQFSETLVDDVNNIGYEADFDWRVSDKSIWGNNGFSTRWGKQWGKKFYSNLNFAYSQYHSEQNNNEKYNVIIPVLEIDTLLVDRTQTLSNNLTDLSIRWDNEYKIGDKSSLAFGALLTKNRIDFQFYFNNTSVENYTQRGQQLSFYVQNTFRPVKDLMLNLGLRTNSYDVTGATFFEPRVSMIYNLTDKINLKGAWGRNNQFMNRVLFEENFYDVNSTFWLIADGINIPHISAEHFVTGFSYETNGFLFDVEAYHKDTDGIIDFLPNVQVDQVTDDVEYIDVYLSGSSKARGIDFLVQKKTGRHTGWLSYSVSKVENSFSELNRGKPFAARQDQRHELKLVNMVSLGNWDLSATWVYGSGKPYSDPRNGTPIVILDSLNTYYVASDYINTERLPAYHRLDISGSYNFKMGKGKAQLGASIYNVYGRKNVKYRRFSALDFDEIANENLSLNEDEPIYSATDVSLLGFTPNLFFNYRF